MSQVGILGSGAVAQALAAGFLKHGHAVMLGSRDTGKLAGFAMRHAGVQLGGVAEAADFGELLVLAAKGTAALAVARAAGAAHMAGKTVIDATNPIADEPPVNGVLRYFTGPNDSLMEQLQAAFPEAHFVKAFSCVGNALMVNPQLPGGPPTMFICGNDDAAKQAVRRVLDTFGWETADMGGAAAARAIEPLAMLWCIPGFLHNDWAHAFRMLRAG